MKRFIIFILLLFPFTVFASVEVNEDNLSVAVGKLKTFLLSDDNTSEEKITDLILDTSSKKIEFVLSPTESFYMNYEMDGNKITFSSLLHYTNSMTYEEADNLRNFSQAPFYGFLLVASINDIDLMTALLYLVQATMFANVQDDSVCVFVPADGVEVKISDDCIVSTEFVGHGVEFGKAYSKLDFDDLFNGKKSEKSLEYKFITDLSSKGYTNDDDNYYVMPTMTVYTDKMDGVIEYINSEEDDEPVEEEEEKITGKEEQKNTGFESMLWIPFLVVSLGGSYYFINKKNIFRKM